MTVNTHNLGEWGRRVKSSVEAVLPAFGQDGSDVTLSEDQYNVVTIEVRGRSFSFPYEDRAKGIVWMRDELISDLIGVYGQPVR